MGQILDFLQYVWDFIASGLYDFFAAVFVILTKVAIYSWFQGLIFLLDISFTVAKEILEELGVSSAVQQSFAMLPSEVSSTLSFLGVPQGLNIVFGGLSTRFVMRFVPFIGR